MADDALPRYHELPEAPLGGRSAWGLFGDDDSVGLMHLLTPERVVAAAGLVRKGAVFALDLELGAIDPPLFRRGAARHTINGREPVRGFDDVLDNFHPQVGSQWDALAHASYAPDVFYNGATPADIRERGRNAIGHWARRGIVTRGVVLDVSDEVDAAGGPGASTAVTVAHLEAAIRRAGVDVRTGDALLVRTGYLAWYRTLDRPARVEHANPSTMTAVGFEQSEAMAEFLWDLGVVAVATDTAGFDRWPADHREESIPFGFMHQVLLGLFGMGIGELWDLEALVADCLTDGVHEALLVSAPMNLPRGIGSPANALAIK